MSTKHPRKSSQGGTILVDVLQGATLTLLATSAVFLIVMHLWSRVYLETESFYLARARLYKNTQNCEPNTRLVSQRWIERKYQCSGANVNLNYELFAGVPKDYGTRKLLQNQIYVRMGK